MNGMLSELQAPLDARLIGEDVRFDGVTTDSRDLQPGDLFIALSGPNFDGHNYVEQVVRQGAAAVLVSRQQTTQLPQLLVADTLKALGKLAAEHRQKCSAKVIGITGSNGKTTVKELLASILANLAPTLYTHGNLNNEIGLPLTLLRITDEPFAVVEMGANHAGEIAYLSSMAQPDLAILNNAGRAHLEGFGSLEGVAHAKGEIIEGLNEAGTLVYNADDAWAGYWHDLPGKFTRVGFGMGTNAQVHGEESAKGQFRIITPEWDIEVTLALAGEHNKLNALAAAAAAWVLKVPPQQIKLGLEQVKPIAGRLEMKQGPEGIRLIDDSYNANPDSVAAAIHYLAGLSEPTGKKYLLLGELAEMGQQTHQWYVNLGHAARQAGIDHLWAVEPAGEAANAFGAGGERFADVQSLLDWIGCELSQCRLKAPDVLLIKGSRSAGMERVVAGLLTFEPGNKPC